MGTVLAADGVGRLPVWRTEGQYPGTDRHDLPSALFRQSEHNFPRLDAEGQTGFGIRRRVGKMGKGLIQKNRKNLTTHFPYFKFDREIKISVNL